MQNVASDLDRVFQTGHYNFIIPENMADPGEVELMYKPSKKQTQVLNAEILSEEETSGVRQKGDTLKAEIWDCEQTSTFVRKLGFLDSEKAGGEMVKPFLHINEVCCVPVTFSSHQQHLCIKSIKMLFSTIHNTVSSFRLPINYWNFF